MEAVIHEKANIEIKGNLKHQTQTELEANTDKSKGNKCILSGRYEKEHELEPAMNLLSIPG